MLSRRFRLRVAAAGGAALALGAVASASAHEHRTVGAINMVVGWSNEPTFTGVRNAVQLFLTDASGQPIDDLGDSLTVRVSYQGQTSDPLALHPAFSGSFGSQGEYDAPLMPTRPGNYTFHFSGTIRGTPIDESFTAGPKTFDTVVDDTSIEFPVKDPSRGELSTAVQRITGRVSRLPAQLDAVQTSARSANDAATRGTILGAVAVVLVIALGVALLLDRRRTQRGTPSAGAVAERSSTAQGRTP